MKLRRVLTLAHEKILCYNKGMSDQVEVYNPLPVPAPVQNARRIIADALRQQGLKEVYVPATGTKMSYKDYLAVMLWDLVAEGQAHFMNGEIIVMEDYDDWLATVKYISQHLDGGASGDAGVNLNFFKVYAGIDPDEV